MDYFDKMYPKLALIEAGYSCDPDDAGGETVFGIARMFNGDWEWWKYVDEIKETFPNKYVEVLNNDPALRQAAKALFRLKYWEKPGYDNITDEELAHRMFDINVNCGQETAAEFLQICLNLLNRKMKDGSREYGEDLIKDGIAGRQTYKRVQTCIKCGDIAYLNEMMRIMQGYHYIVIASMKPSQRKYVRGWLKRV